MHEQTATTELPAFFSLRAVRDKVLRMTLLWFGLGIVVGILSAPPERGIVGMVAGAIAGIIVLPFMGVFLGLIGGQWRETLLGGLAGLILSFGIGVASGVPELRPVANVGLVGGALVGATFFSYVSYLRKALAALSQVKSRG